MVQMALSFLPFAPTLPMVPMVIKLVQMVKMLPTNGTIGGPRTHNTLSYNCVSKTVPV